jgi:CRP-like cAMP-binding protein
MSFIRSHPSVSAFWHPVVLSVVPLASMGDIFMAPVDPLVAKLSQTSTVTAAEREILSNAISRIRDVPADEDMVREGDKPTESTLLLSGFAARYTNVANGKRQIVAIHIAGDFVDLHGFLLRQMDHGIFAMSPCRIASVPHQRLLEITERFPHLTRLLWLSTLIDAAIHRQWMVALGRLTAVGRVAHLICELYVRLAAIKATEGFRFQLPITQEELADTFGMSIVHLNRSVQELRSRDLFTWQRDQIEILDWDRLVEVGEFDPAYLNLDVIRPRSPRR